MGGEAGELCSVGELQLSSAGEGSVEVGAGALVAQLVAWGRREGWQVARGSWKCSGHCFRWGAAPSPPTSPWEGQWPPLAMGLGLAGEEGWAGASGRWLGGGGGGGLSCGWWRKGCLVDDGGRDVFWKIYERLSNGWWRKGFLVNGRVKIALWMTEDVFYFGW